MDQSISKLFHVALVNLLEQEGRGAQSRLAGQHKIDRGYLNAIVKGRKTGNDELRSKIAAHFNLNYEDMLALGRRLVNECENDELRGKNTNEREGGALIALQGKEPMIGQLALGKFGEAQSGVVERISNLAKILESRDVCRDILVELSLVFSELAGTKQDNLALHNRMKEMESRIAALEAMQEKQQDYAG